MGAATPAAPTPGDRLVLVSHPLCPYVQRAVIALTEKGVPFERLDIDLARKPDWFAAISPLGKTPVLLVPAGGRFEAIFESAVICEYLEDTLQPRLHRVSAIERARHRAWIELASATLNQIGQYYAAPDAATLDGAARALDERLARIEGGLGGGPYFDGDRFSLVDAAFAPVFRYFDVFDAVAPERGIRWPARVSAWRRALAGRGSVQAAVGRDYPSLLRAFVRARQGELARRWAGIEQADTAPA